MALSGSATSGGGGSIFADSATSASVPLADLSPDFLDSLRGEVLSGGFPHFVVGPNLTVPLSAALTPNDLVPDFLETEGVVLDDFVSDDFASADFCLVEALADDCACDRVLAAGFFVPDLVLAIPDNGSAISGFPSFRSATELCDVLAQSRHSALRKRCPLCHRKIG